MKKKVTIRDVAKHAGVSVASVSYVVNGIQKVSEETKERVQQAIAELGYQPNFAAVSLSKNRSYMIGVVMPLIEDTLAPIFKENSYYSEFISGIEYVARKNGYDFLITGVNKAEECKNWIAKRNLDGIIFLGMFPEHLHEEMKALSIPILLIDAYEEYADHFHTIRIADEEGGFLAGQHLLQKGHTKIAYVAHSENSPVDARRYIGYQRALYRGNVKEALHLTAKYSTFKEGYKIGEKLSSSDVTAVFASSDLVALGIMKALQDRGKKVPTDIAVVGFDDLTVSSYTSPELSTVRQDVFHKGSLSAQTLIDVITDRPQETKHIELPVELVVRESSNT
ncbi:LacI family DNA-binding transcriptional regulator [Ectobacillus antri]|jgi:DNA-binding LacI/PurR family transcriptional regulator|uniref:LacI family DNA-binding transcriptional regulator n=3 Tax=Ectobacillus antri TaxID=2486280 RepID=A0ABT6H4Y4_9BACI|nr:LacI family DNA-binding transcriptional regulator [Ectobacillus antri]MDG5753710.1 LacI family DNA-binding transcriptional regulator [Ectobacillus antri]